MVTVHPIHVLIIAETRVLLQQNKCTIQIRNMPQSSVGQD